MVGPFLKDKELYDLKKSEERTNSLRKREAKVNFHVDTVICGCLDPTCGGWHKIVESRPLPTDDECKEILKGHNRAYKKKNA
jgi:hypothetical protein